MRRCWCKKVERRVYNRGGGMKGFVVRQKDARSQCLNDESLVVYYGSILNPGECIVTSSTGMFGMTSPKGFVFVHHV